MLKVKLLRQGAKAPLCIRPGEDLGYDLFAVQNTVLYYGYVTAVPTGVAVAEDPRKGIGFLIKDRSSMAAKGVFTHAGVIDVGYRGEIVVLMSHIAGCPDTVTETKKPYIIKKGDKIAQLVPVFCLTTESEVVDELPTSDRGGLGFGSSGR